MAVWWSFMSKTFFSINYVWLMRLLLFSGEITNIMNECGFGVGQSICILNSDGKARCIQRLFGKVLQVEFNMKRTFSNSRVRQRQALESWQRQAASSLTAIWGQWWVPLLVGARPKFLPLSPPPPLSQHWWALTPNRCPPDDPLDSKVML